MEFLVFLILAFPIVCLCRSKGSFTSEFEISVFGIKLKIKNKEKALDDSAKSSRTKL